MDATTAARERQEAIDTLADLIHDIRIAMLTTVDDGVLRSRPMATQATRFDGTLWFFTGKDTAKTDEIAAEHDVNVSYAAPDDQRYVSVSGKARLVDDRQKVEELWHPFLKAWFPDGKDDPHLQLLKVEVDQAEYWDSPHGAVVRLVGLAKALITGERYEPGENEKLDL